MNPPEFDRFYLLGLIEMLRGIHNGRVAHDRDSILQALAMLVGLIDRGETPPRDLLESTIARGLALYRNETR